MSNDDTTILNLNQEEIDKPRFGYGIENGIWKEKNEHLLVESFSKLKQSLNHNGLITNGTIKEGLRTCMKVSF